MDFYSSSKLSQNATTVQETINTQLPSSFKEKVAVNGDSRDIFHVGRFSRLVAFPKCRPLQLSYCLPRVLLVFVFATHKFCSFCKCNWGYDGH